MTTGKGTKIILLRGKWILNRRQAYKWARAHYPGAKNILFVSENWYVGLVHFIIHTTNIYWEIWAAIFFFRILKNCFIIGRIIEHWEGLNSQGPLGYICTLAVQLSQNIVKLWNSFRWKLVESYTFQTELCSSWPHILVFLVIE